jgi:competence ComEA-like helix-hairpin-helix protein
MVLGVDDFNQEFAYLSNRDQWLARDLIGYGTICGLEVSLTTEGALAPGVRVGPGIAINPLGQFIKVETAQCAALNEWLIKDSVKAEIVNNHRLTNDKIRPYLVLCYRDCLTDNLPIPGEPCRAETGSDALFKPSRIQDDYFLDLVWEVPDQAEEDYLRNFVAWLRQIKTASTGSDLDDFAAAIREAIGPLRFTKIAAPVTITIPSPRQQEYLDVAFRIWATEVRPLCRGEAYWRDFANWIRQLKVAEAGSSLDDFAAAIRNAITPQGRMRTPAPEGIIIPSARQAEYLRLAFGIWETEVCPLLNCADASCVTPILENCILLAELEISLAGSPADGWRVSGDVIVKQEKRPYLLHSRFLREWLLAGPAEESTLREPTRILATSWPHGGQTQLDIELDGQQEKGLLVAFGKRTPGDGGLVQVAQGSLDPDTFQVFAEEAGTESGVDFYTLRRIHPAKILPVQVKVGDDGLVTQASEASGPEAEAAALLLGKEAFSYLENKKMLVIIKGDYVLDETGSHAIHASPVGRASAGGEGGNFESWVWVGLLRNVNTATEYELQVLSGIGPALAKRIVEHRTEHGDFSSVDGLLAVRGVGQELLNGIRPFITTKS